MFNSRDYVVIMSLSVVNVLLLSVSCGQCVLLIVVYSSCTFHDVYCLITYIIGIVVMYIMCRVILYSFTS